MSGEIETEPINAGKVLDVDRFYHGMLEASRRGREAVLCPGKAGQIYIGVPDTEPDGPDQGKFCLLMQSSQDGGRSWEQPWIALDRRGHKVRADHHSMFRMKSGKLGMVYGDHEQFPSGHPGRDGGSGMMFRDSQDEGRTWSDPVVVYPQHAVCCPGHAIVLSNGRIVAPAERWISHDTTGESEEFYSPNLCFSLTAVSDDEGKTWQPSLSELFLSHYRVAYNLEEPSVVELKDGRLLMFLRSQLGRIYRSYSSDGGISWSRPEGVPIAAAYTPPYLRWLPGGELLLIWNQSSCQEILTGTHRCRLSCAISRDEGHSWENFKNLESLDDTTIVPAPPEGRLEVIEQFEEPDYYQPTDTRRYYRAPGAIRICYPSVVFCGDEAVVVYDYGLGVLGEKTYGIKLRIIPVQWFVM